MKTSKKASLLALQLLDFYGSFGLKFDTKKLLAVAAAIKIILEAVRNERTERQREILAATVRNIFLFETQSDSLEYRAFQSLTNETEKNLKTVDDYRMFALVCQSILAPLLSFTNQLYQDEGVVKECIAKAILDQQGSKGLSNLINIMDGVGSRGCMTVERERIVHAFGHLRTELEKLLDDNEMDVVLTAFCQEFERRVAQKRKGRAGRSVEGTTSLILKYFNVDTVSPPEHFTTGLEVDRWIKTKDKWIIGISCKRTLRERWKQAYTTDLDLLSRHKIRQLWHVITYDKDLSDEKITEIGSHRAVLYLPDDSPKTRYLHAKDHPGMKDYVRPMTEFINDLKKLTS